VSGNHLLAAIHKEEVMKKWTIVLVALAVVMLIDPARAQSPPNAARGHAKPVINRIRPLLHLPHVLVCANADGAINITTASATNTIVHFFITSSL